MNRPREIFLEYKWIADSIFNEKVMPFNMYQIQKSIREADSKLEESAPD